MLSPTGDVVTSSSCGELVALAMWLMAERAAGAAGGAGASAYAPLLAALPHATDSPILWDDKERLELLQVGALGAIREGGALQGGLSPPLPATPQRGGRL